MNATQILLVQASFGAIEPNAAAVAQAFYGRLFELDPSLRTLFHRDLNEQGHMLMSVLKLAVNGLSRLDTIVPAVQALGTRHVAYGVTPAMYTTVGEALLWTLETGLGDAFTPELRAAWLEAYILLSSAMKDAAYGTVPA